MAELTSITVNRSPHRHFTQTGGGGGASASASSNVTYIMLLLDMSGSNIDATRRQLEDLITFLSTPAGSTYKVYVWCFGAKDTIDPQYGRMGQEWAPLRKLHTYYSNRIARTGGNRNYVSYFPWPTYTYRMIPALQDMNRFIDAESGATNTPIALAFLGDGAFSDSLFIARIKAAKIEGNLKRVVSFTSIFAANTSDAPKITLTVQLQEILMTTNSAMIFATHKLSRIPTDLRRVIQTFNTSGTVAPPGYSAILDETYHDYLTSGSIATILKANKGLIGKYISFIVDQFEKCPIVFTSNTNLIGKIYKALTLLTHFKNDTFNIKMYLSDRISVLADKKDFLAPQRKSALLLIRKQDGSAYKLAREILAESHPLHECITITNLPYFDFDDIIRDGSCSKLINLLDTVWNEHSTCAFVKSSSLGIPILPETATTTEMMTSFKLCSGLFGIPDAVLGGNVLLVIAMYILTNDCVGENTRPAAMYLKTLCHRFIFNDIGTLRSMVFKDDGTFHDNMYCAGYARVLYMFFTAFECETSTLTTADITAIRSIYTAITKIIVWRNYAFTIDIPKLTYDFHNGDLVLISPKSWGEGTCPLINMPNLSMIVPRDSRDRAYHRHKYKCMFTEGDNKDFFYVAAEFLAIFLARNTYGAGAGAGIDDYKNTAAFKAIRRYQRDTWMSNLHENKVRLKDGSFDTRDGDVATHMTYKEQLAAIIALPAVCSLYDPASTAPSLINFSTPVPKKMLGAILGFNVWESVIGTPLSFKQPAIKFAMEHRMESATLMTEDYDTVRATLGASLGSLATVDTWKVPSDLLVIESFMPYAKHVFTRADFATISRDFTRKFTLLRSGTECDCGCEFSLGPGTKSVSPGCGHKYSEACYQAWCATSGQSPRDIHLDASDCPMGCVSCLQDPLILTTGHRIPRSDLSGTVVAASSSNCIAMCSMCEKPNVIYPRSCTTHMDETSMRCEACSDQSFWECPTVGCQMRHEHGGGCRWMRCCPVHTRFDEPCPDDCDCTVYGDFGNIIARGCGTEYKMADGLVQDAGVGPAVSDGSYYY